MSGWSASPQPSWSVWTSGVGGLPSEYYDALMAMSEAQKCDLPALILLAIFQAEEGTADWTKAGCPAPGPINGSGFGGFFGCHVGWTYTHGAVSVTTTEEILLDVSTASFILQAQAAFAAFANAMDANSNDVWASENAYQGGGGGEADFEGWGIPEFLTGYTGDGGGGTTGTGGGGGEPLPPGTIHVGIAMWSVAGTPTICGYDLDSGTQMWAEAFTGWVQDGSTGTAFNSDRTKLAVVSGGYSEVYLLNTGSGIADDSATISVEGDNPFALAVIANDDTFVTCGASDPTCPVSAYTFGNSTPLWTNTITHGFLPACTQTEVWVIDSETHTLEIYSLADGSALGSLSVPGTVEEYSNIVFHNGKAYFFTLESGTSFNLYTIDVATHTIDSVVTMDNTVPTETVLLNQDGQLWIWQNVGSPVFRASQIDLSSETIVIESPTSSLWPVGFAGSSTSVGAMDYSDYTEGHTWVASVDNATGTVSRFAVDLQHLPGGNSGSLQAMYDLTI